MIRVYSANFTKEDYVTLSRIFTTGLKQIVTSNHCLTYRQCFDCSYKRVCLAVTNAVDFCDKKSAEMVES